MSTNNYLKSATDFLKKTKVSFKCEFLKNDFHFDGDKEKRDIYKITFKRGERKFSLNFGQSIAKSKKFVDKINGNEFGPTGNCIKGKLKVINLQFLNEYCNEVNGTPPNEYDVLACLTKYDPGDFENFCSEFGYDTDSRSAKKTYKAVVKEWMNVCSLWNDEEIEQLSEIQ